MGKRAFTSNTVLSPTRLDSSGMGLAQVMMGAGLASLVMLAMAQVGQISNKAIKSSELTNDFNQIVNSIQLALNDENLCRSALVGTGRGSLRLGPRDFPRALNQIQIRGSNGSAGTALAKVNASPDANGMVIRKLEISEALSPPTEVKPGLKKQAVKLRLEAEKIIANRTLAGENQNVALGKQHYTKEFVMSVVTDDDNYVRNCYSESSPTEIAERAARKSCEDQLGHYDEALYPPCRMEQTWVLDTVTRIWRTADSYLPNTFPNVFACFMVLAYTGEDAKKIPTPRYRFVARRVKSLPNFPLMVEELPVDQLYQYDPRPGGGYGPAFKHYMSKTVFDSGNIHICLAGSMVLPDGKIYVYNPDGIPRPQAANQHAPQHFGVTTTYEELKPQEWQFVVHIDIGKRPVNWGVHGPAGNPVAHSEENPP